MFGMLKRLLAPVGAPADANAEPHEYLFVDRERLTSYAEQIAGPFVRDATPSWRIGVSATSAQIEASRSASMRARTDHEMIALLLRRLRDKRLLASARPTDRGDMDTPFVLERTSAYKAILPLDGRPAPRGLREIAIWVSAPASEALGKNGQAGGVLLYLIEAYWENDGRAERTHSGLSALNALVGELTETKLLDAAPKAFRSTFKFAATAAEAEAEPRYYMHPLEVLAELGAMIQAERVIETLYRKRYMSDEVHIGRGADARRAYDLVGYPIFVRTA